MAVAHIRLIYWSKISVSFPNTQNGLKLLGRFHPLLWVEELLEKDFPEFKGVWLKIKKYFARGLVHVGETRWFTHHSCVRRLLDNKKALVQLIDTSVFDRIDSAKKQPIMDSISDNSFWTKLTAIEADLRPTSKYVGILEAGTCCLSDVYRCFAEMTIAYQNNPLIRPLIERR